MDERGFRKGDSVRRLEDGAMLSVLDVCVYEILIEEPFEFADGGPTPRLLRMWHPAARYELVTPAPENQP